MSVQLDSTFDALIRARSVNDVARILRGLGDNPDVTLQQPFAGGKLEWHPFGNNLSNISTIGLASKAGRSLTERLTNAMDAILEERARTVSDPPSSARLAARQWFGRPVSGPDEGLFNWAFGEADYDRKIAVVLLDSGIESAPTLDIYDEGIGIVPEKFASTILSLQSGNKINKRFLIGAFGQGGSSTLAFSDYVLVASRSVANPDKIGFTVIRVVRLDETYKEDTYGYLALAGTGGQIVPSIEYEGRALNLYPDVEAARVPTLSHGTLVRHYSYRLSTLSRTLSPSPGNLYHYLHCSLFDPLFPLRIIDLRDPSRPKDERVTGSRNRLMQHVKAKSEDKDQEGRTEVRHYAPMEYVVPVGSESPAIGIEYWVVLNYRKSKRKGKEELILRSQSNELFVDTGYPIVATLNGQNQGEQTARLLRDVGLSMVARHAVIHIDATNADSRIRRQLFSTNRESLKDGPVLDGLLSVLRTKLEEDDKLHDLERELTEKLAKRESESTDAEVKRQITRLLKEAGFQVKKEGPADDSAKTGQEEGAVKRSKRSRPRVSDPLPTLPYPNVTRFEIVFPKPKMEVHAYDTETIMVETDADSRFYREDRIGIRVEPPLLEMASVLPLRGGRLRWRLRPTADAKQGDAGKIVVYLTKPDGIQLMDSTEFEVLPEKITKVRKSQGDVPPFDVIPINPIDDAERWGMVWPELADVEDETELSGVAYKPIRSGDEITVYYSTVFEPYKLQLDRLKQKSPAIAQLYGTQYEIWIGYHAILQIEGMANAAENEGLSEEVIERLLEADRARVARMQVKQAINTAELIHEKMQLAASST